jgi:Domain of unknown function (DUF4118)
MGLSKTVVRETSASCRLALQVAMQLPENVDEARRVLNDANNLLENFLAPVPREIQRRPPISLEVEPVLPLSRAATLTTIVGFFFAPLGAVLAALTGLEAASLWTLLVGESWVSLVLGRPSGIIFSVLASLAHNFFARPPMFEFNAPVAAEFLQLAGFIMIAVVLPAIARSASRFRRLISGDFDRDAVAAAMRSQD